MKGGTSVQHYGAGPTVTEIEEESMSEVGEEEDEAEPGHPPLIEEPGWNPCMRP